MTPPKMKNIPAPALADLYKLLEFDKILAHLKQFCLSDLARERLDAIGFLVEKNQIATALQEVSEQRALLEQDPPFPLQQLYDIRDYLEVAAVAGNHLGCAALVEIAHNLNCSRLVRLYLEKRREAYPHLWAHAQPIMNFKTLEQEIAAKIDFQTLEVKDSASPKLNQIRREIARSEQEIRRVLDHLFKLYAQKGYLQEELVTLKDGRLVLPVKWEDKGKVKGLVHDHSASGSTFFIEPFEAVEINNEIRRLRGEEALEIERILRELTAALRENLDGISQNFKVLAHFDFLQAKARFSKLLNCGSPALNEKNVIHLAQASHPLLLLRKPGAQVVPLDLRMDEGVKTLVITGPNAGGKTVALKTAGLLALMTQSGLPIPANADSTLPIFKKMFVDIGDFQSIEQDLSTFSSHLNRIRTILENADAESLVLIDEIGVGTDPDEGSALAVAVLEELTRRGAKAIVTTHHGALKEFAFNTPGVENGSMEFEMETLRPTYRFRMGAPGSSYALEIAQRLGLPHQLLARSRELIGSEKGNLERLILDLERKVQESEKLSQKLDLEKIRLEGLSNLYKERHDAIKKEEKTLKEKALRESEQILRQANAAVEKAIKEIRERQAEHAAITDAKQLIEEAKANVAAVIQILDGEQPPVESAGLSHLQAGDEVFWHKQKTYGQVVEDYDGSGKVLIQVNNLKFRVPIDELSESKVSPQAAKSTTPVAVQTAAKSDVLPEINLLGCTLDEAISKTDKFLDDALLAGWNQVRIIHGKSTGVLRKGLAEFLDKHPRVKSKKMGAWNEGDFGVTVVELD